RAGRRGRRGTARGHEPGLPPGGRGRGREHAQGLVVGRDRARQRTADRDPAESEPGRCRAGAAQPSGVCGCRAARGSGPAPARALHPGLHGSHQHHALARPVLALPGAAHPAVRARAAAGLRGGDVAGRGRPPATLGTAIALVLVQQTYTLFKAFAKHHQPAAYTDAAGRRHPYALFYYDETWRDHDLALDWLAAHAAPDAVAASSTPQWVYLRTGLHSVMPPYESSAPKAQHLLDGVPVSYLVVDNLS